MTGLELHALAAVVAASLLFTALSGAIYRHDPSRRKVFLAALGLALLAAPWWTVVGLGTLPVGLPDAQRWSLAVPVPWPLLAVWWLVGGTLMGRSLFRVWRGRCALGRLPPLTHTYLGERCVAIARALKAPADIRLRSGDEPCVSSLGSAVLVLPPGAQSWPSATLDAVLCHEIAHLKRRDDRLALVIRLVADWYWWMPWLRRVRARYVDAMEESCDDLASRIAGGREAYVDGLVDAARRLSDDPHDRNAAWVALLGRSHLAHRVARLIERPRPTLDHGDGRWTLLWTSLVCVALLTMRPAAIPDTLPDGVSLLPLQAFASGRTTGPPDYPLARVEVQNHLRHSASSHWQPLQTTARDPLPVYPARALEQRLSGTVTVELAARASRDGGLTAMSTPQISSSDPTGVLAAAVARVLARHSGGDLGAGLGSLRGYNNDIDTPPPGTRLRLRKTYRFVVSQPPDDASITTGGIRP
jgi:beta-lactamase regulating signal transducer with metallopeptidase domain